MRKTNQILALVIACYMAITLFYAFGLVESLSSRVPVDDVDPLFNSWVVAWNGHTLATDPLNLFSANQYFPYGNVLAYSDLMLPPSILMLPVTLLSPSPVVAYNLLVILSFIFSATAMFLLIRLLTKSASVGFVAGIAYAFSTYRVSQMGHLQLLMDGFLVLMLYFAHLYLNTAKPRYLALAGVALSLQALSSWYYGFYGFLILFFFLAYFVSVKSIHLNARFFKHLLMLGVIIGAALTPFILPYLKLRATLPNFGRTLGEAVHFSARGIDYFSTKNPIFIKIFGGSWVPTGSDMWEHLLFPGIFAVVGVVVAAALIFAKSDSSEQPPLFSVRIKLFYLLLGLVALALSFGPFIIRNGDKIPLPYLLAWNIIPGFKAMRVPSRFGLIVILALIILASYGFSRLSSIVGKRIKVKKAVRFSVIVISAFLVFATQVSWPFALSPEVPSANNLPKVYKWLATKKNKVVMELPSATVSKNSIVGGWNRDVRYVFFSAFHWNRVVNGYSGYTPPEYQQIIKTTAGFPDKLSVDVLRQVGVDYVVYHTSDNKQLSGTLIDSAQRVAGVKLIQRFGDDFVFRLAQVEARVTRPVLSASMRGPKSGRATDSINIAWRVTNKTNDRLVISTKEQPTASYSWDSGRLEPLFPRLPLVIKPRQTAWVQAQIKTPELAGKDRLAVTLDSPLLRRKHFKMRVKIIEGLTKSTDATDLKGRFISVSLSQRASAGSKMKVDVRIKNTGQSIWQAKFDPATSLLLPLDRGEVHIATSFKDAEGKQVGEVQDFSLAYDVGPGESYSANHLINTPRKPGDYQLDIDLVSLGVAWFKDLGTNSPSREVTIYGEK